MATTKRESNLGKEKRGASPSSNPSTGHGPRRSNSNPIGSPEKQVPNYLRPTMSSRTDATKNAKKPGLGTEDTSQKPNILRRRSFDRPPSAARVQKALISPGRDKPTTSRSASFSSKSAIAAASKPTLERVAKKPIAAKPQTTLSSSRSMKKTSPTTKKGPTLSSSAPASEKPLSNNIQDKKEAQNQESVIKHESEHHSLDPHNRQIEDAGKDDPQVDQEDHSEYQILPKAEESTDHPDAVDATEVKSLAEEAKDSPVASDVLSPVSEEYNVAETEEIEEKLDEEKSDHHTQNDEDDDRENQSKEETDVGHDHQEIVPHEEAEPEAKDKVEENNNNNNATEELAATKELVGEEKQVESRQENEVEESSKEQIAVEVGGGEVEESKPAAAPEAAANVVVVKSQGQAAGHGKKESATPYNDVIEETASKLLEERKNKVRALVGAFETVIDKETSNAK